MVKIDDEEDEDEEEGWSFRAERPPLLHIGAPPLCAA
jgi:hypothetical protein